MVLHLLHDVSQANGNEVTAVNMGKKTVVHLTLQSTGCIVCTPAKRGSNCSRSVSVLFDEQ